MKSIMSLFLSQSYKDAWDDYLRSLNRTNFVCWDYVILTASNEQQAVGFRTQLRQRFEAGFLPPETCFAVLSDPDGRRVGSGGATLNVLKYIAEQCGEANFADKRILVIHSGGDSKRAPQYSALGKLFSPVPHELPDGRASTLFDEFMIGMSGVPARMRDGMLLLSGDVLLLFNPLQIDFPGRGAAAISFKEPVKTGRHHGVFLMNDDGDVAEFLHKQPMETLRAKGAVNAQDCVDIDTGAVLFSAEVLSALYGLISSDSIFDLEKGAAFINERVRLSLYGDFLYPLAHESTLENFYREKPEGDFGPELAACRTAVWQVLRPFRMKLLRLSPAKFVHFGTTREIMQLMTSEIAVYGHLGWARQVNSSVPHSDVAAYNSVASSRAICGRDTYLEVSYIHSTGKVGSRVILSYVDIHDEMVPDGVVLHGLKQKDGCFVVRIYGVDDNPKDVLEQNCSFLGTTLVEFMEKNGIRLEELWLDEDHSLWQAHLYPACDTIREAVAAALNIHAMACGRGDVATWREARRKSLSAGFKDADEKALIVWDKHMRELVQMNRVSEAIQRGKCLEDVKGIIDGRHLTPVQQRWLDREVGNADVGLRMRLYYYLGCSIGGVEGEGLVDACFRTIGLAVLESTLDGLEFNQTCRIVRDEHTVHLPLRVNWGGGWSDTPPYCNEHGGTVLNAAILLEGQMPVRVTLRRLRERKIVFDSRDMDSHGEFWEIESLQRCGDPYDPFVLQKAALLACGILPVQGGNLHEILMRLGGGIFMGTEVVGVPKGSGLGTSSILAGACVKALFEFMGIPQAEGDICGHVLCMEQIMSTGGGWQDQVGGLSGGIKYTTSSLGFKQSLRVRHLDLDQTTLDELNERFALIYTGQRRLARNLLRDVVGRYIGNEPDAFYALEEIQRIAALMRFELERGNVDGFAALLSQHWDMSKKLDAGSTNTCINQIFHAVDHLIDGRMICGAGGGGFLQVILKRGVTREELREQLHAVFQDSGVDVWTATVV